MKFLSLGIKYCCLVLQRLPALELFFAARFLVIAYMMPIDSQMRLLSKLQYVSCARITLHLFLIARAEVDFY